jgi:hypothetical protein
MFCATAFAAVTDHARAATAPTIGSSWVTDVTATSANLRAQVSPGGATATYRFEYISEAAYRANLDAVPPRDGFDGAARAPSGGAAAIGSGSGVLTVLQHLAGLSPATTYRYRAVATNSVDTTIGPERRLATEAPTNIFRLLDNRGWEMVSPIDKNGGAIQGPGGNFGGDVLQAAADGNSVTYSSADSFGAAPKGAPPASQYLATRGGTGWSSENITAPLLSGGYGDEPTGVPFQLFATDLARGVELNGRRCGEAAQSCPRSYSLRDSSTGALAVSPEAPGLRFAGASPDLRHVILSTCAALAEGAIEVPGSGISCDPEDTNLYAWSGAQLELVNELQGGPAGPFATLGAPAGAVSEDGSRIYWAQAGSVLFLREGHANREIAEGAEFQTATPDGRVAFYVKDEHLYSYDAETDQSTEYFLAPIGEGAGFGGLLGLLGASDDGSYVYYVGGDGALYLRHDGTDTEVAAAAAASDYPPATGTARVSADGLHLLFLSAAELTDYENNGVTEVYLYGPPPGGGPARLVCVSCNPTGERPSGPSSIPGAVANGKGEGATRAYKPRSLSADGSRVFFDSSDSLATQDTNSRPDVYEWEAPGAGSCDREGGCVELISSGRSPVASTFIDASSDASDAFFLTDSSLFPLDPGSFDLYDARVGGGFAVPSGPIPCIGDACQALPAAPEDPTPGTLVGNPGNPPPRIVRPKQKTHHRKKHRRRKHHKRAGRRRGHR